MGTSTANSVARKAVHNSAGYYDPPEMFELLVDREPGDTHHVGCQVTDPGRRPQN